VTRENKGMRKERGHKDEGKERSEKKGEGRCSREEVKSA
jgi:hypothetical protein